MALHHAASGEPVDLRPLGSSLGSCQTKALVKTDSFEAIRLVMRSGDELPPHKIPSKFTLHCLEGRVEIGLENGSVELSANEWVYFDGGVLHSVRSRADSSLLLTIMLPAAGALGTA